jgi:hypothetical protein
MPYTGPQDPNNPYKNWVPSYPGEMPPSITGSGAEYLAAKKEADAIASGAAPTSYPESGNYSFWNRIFGTGSSNSTGNTSDGAWSKLNEIYNKPLEQRMARLFTLTGQQSPIQGEGPNAIWMTRSGIPMTELEVIEMAATPQGLAALWSAPKTSSASGPPDYYYQAQAELIRAQIADIPLARQQAQEEFIAAETQRKWGRQAEIIGLRTQNSELALRGKQIANEQEIAAAQASNRIAELDIQQENLQQQYDYNVSAANAAAINAANQFNIEMGFNVEQANVAAQQRRQEQLQSLARDISESAKAPGDYGKLAALTLANTGWGAPATAIGRGEDLRTTQSLSPLESQLRTRKDVMAQPDRPFTFTPYKAEIIQAPIIAPVKRSNFSIPTPNFTQKDADSLKASGDMAIKGLQDAVNKIDNPVTKVDWIAAALKSGVIDSETANNMLSGNQDAAPDSTPAAAEGGVIPRYEDGGVNMQDPMQAYQSGGAIALYNALRSAGSSEQQAADFVNTVMSSGAALQQNTAAAQQAQAMQQAQAPMPQRPAYMPMTDASNDTEAQLLRLGMSNPYMGGGYGTGGTYGQEDAMPAAAGWYPQIPRQFTGYSNEVDAAPAVAGWTPQVPDAFMQRKAQFDSDFSALKSNQISGEEFEKRNKDLDEDQFLQFTRLYGIPAAGAAALAAGAAVPTFMKWLMKGNQYRYNPAIDYNILNSTIPPYAPPERGIDPNIMRSVGLGGTLEDAQRLGLYATGGVANGAYISGERGPELNIPLGNKTIILNQKQMKAAGIDFKKLMSDSVKPKGFADGGVFDQGWGNVTDPDRTLSMNFLNDALARARAGTPWQSGALPTPVYASTPGFSPLVMQTLGSLTSMAQGIPTEYFQELAAKYRPSGVRESVTQRTA